jgi:hypothetical protein
VGFRGVGFAACLLLAATSMAAVPEGPGTVGLALGFSPSNVMVSGFGNIVGTQGHYQSGPAWQAALAADAPLWQGLALGLDVRTLQAQATNSSEALGNGEVSSETQYAYVGRTDLRLYPAAFLRRPFLPGGNANPDGWYGWPSVSVRYCASKLDDMDQNKSKLAFMDSNYDYFILDQSLEYCLTLPAAYWLTLRAAYGRNIGLDLDLPNFGAPPLQIQRGGAWEDESYGLTFYVNMAGGAAQDSTRPFFPHLGRMGQLRIDLGWDRRLYLLGGFDVVQNYTYQFLQSVQTYTVTVGAPVMEDLGVSLSAVVVQPDQVGGYWANYLTSYNRVENRDSLDLSLKATWAFGLPAARTDH